MRPLCVTFIAAILALALSSCDNAIYDHDDNCKEGVELRFVFDYNMEGADAFASQVHCLTVIVYDENEKVVGKYSETSEALRQEGYRMVLPLKRGNYHVAAYGGMECDDASFRFQADPLTSRNSERRVGLDLPSSEGTPECHTLLHDHFYGSRDFTVNKASLEYTKVKVEMMRNTNNFRILLQQADGLPLKASDFSVEITDDNVLFAHDNALIPTSQGVVYTPWSQGESPVGLNGAGEEWTVAHFDLSTSRLISRNTSRSAATPSGTSSVNSPRLVIRNAGNSAVIADIPLINYLLLLKSDRYGQMGNQEFLDRQGEWNMVLFLDKNLAWINTHIVVNDWVVRINDTDL